jgi:uncharacterized protein (DUF1800 family)
MNRRNFFQSLSDKRKATVKSKIQKPATGLEPYAGVWETEQVTHLLKMTMFGATVADVNHFNQLTMSQSVDALIDAVVPVPLPPVNNYATVSVPDPDVAAGVTWVNAPPGTSGTINSNRRNSLHAWWAGLMINQTRSIAEKMVLCWHNHFVTEADGIDPRYSYRYNQLLRKHATGNFKTFIREITLNPAMLVYLNGNKNTVGAPNENYARELQELFAIGKGPASFYTESDVQAAAKVLTGYDINTSTMEYKFVSTRHDTGNKQFSAFYNNKIIQGKTGTAGETELDELIEMLFAQKELSLFICRKLYRFFVYYEIDEVIENKVIEPLAEIFRNNNYELKPVLKALFKSAHFYDPLLKGCMIKSPLDFLAGMVREFQVVFPDPTTDYVATYNLWRVLTTTSLEMGQELGNPPSVAGWPAYYQVPQFHQLWINSNSLPDRNLFSDTLIGSGFTKNSKKIVINVLQFTESLQNASDPVNLINQVENILLQYPLSDAVKLYLKVNFLLSGQDSDSYWTTAWNNYLANPANSSNKTIVQSRLQNLYKYLMNMAEYQLC